MGHLYRLPRPDRRLPRRHRAGDARAPRGVRVRHHVRHEQRVRLRLPARQHGDVARPAGAARRTGTRSSTRWTRSSSTRRARRSSSRARWATRATCSTRSTTTASRGSCGSRTSWSTRLVAEGERALEAEGHGRRVAAALQGAAGRAEEQAPAEGAAGVGRQAARAEDGARAHRRPQAAGERSSSTATSRRTCCTCSTRRATRST